MCLVQECGALSLAVTGHEAVRVAVSIPRGERSSVSIVIVGDRGGALGAKAGIHPVCYRSIASGNLRLVLQTAGGQLHLASLVTVDHPLAEDRAMRRAAI